MLFLSDLVGYEELARHLIKQDSSPRAKIGPEACARRIVAEVTGVVDWPSIGQEVSRALRGNMYGIDERRARAMIPEAEKASCGQCTELECKELAVCFLTAIFSRGA